MERKKHTHIGCYGLLIIDDEILLINKAAGPYKGKLDLPGGSIKHKEKPEKALQRELKEETGLDIENYELFDANSVYVDWNYDGIEVTTHHIGIFYRILNYKNELKESVQIDEINNDSLGAKFYNIKDLRKDNLSLIAILELEKLGYDLK